MSFQWKVIGGEGQGKPGFIDWPTKLRRCDPYLVWADLTSNLAKAVAADSKDQATEQTYIGVLVEFTTENIGEWITSKIDNIAYGHLQSQEAIGSVKMLSCLLPRKDLLALVDTG